MIDDIADSKLDTLQFTYKGNTYYGFVMEINAKLAHDQESSISLFIITPRVTFQNL
jgi:hypothetical protein